MTVSAFIKSILKAWPVLLITLLIVVGASFAYMRFTDRVYQATAFVVPDLPKTENTLSLGVLAKAKFDAWSDSDTRLYVDVNTTTNRVELTSVGPSSDYCLESTNILVEEIRLEAESLEPAVAARVEQAGFASDVSLRGNKWLYIPGVVFCGAVASIAIAFLWSNRSSFLHRKGKSGINAVSNDVSNGPQLADQMMVSTLDGKLE